MSELDNNGATAATAGPRVLHKSGYSTVFVAPVSPSPFAQAEAQVIKAYHKHLLQPRHITNIQREVSLLTRLKRLRVPGVVNLQGTAEDASNVYLLFTAAAGGDLYQRLSRGGLLSEAQLCREVVVPLLRVLAALHGLGIIHRDVKPENLFISRCGQLLLGDFGLALNAAERPVSRVGTPDYMAPEVLAQPSADAILLRGLRASQLPSYCAKADVWAVGVLVYEALSGRTPFAHSDPALASLRAQFAAPPPLPAGVSGACAAFAAAALAKRPAERLSARELLSHPWVLMHTAPAELAAHASGPAPGCCAPTPTPTPRGLDRFHSAPAGSGSQPQLSASSSAGLGVSSLSSSDLHGLASNSAAAGTQQPTTCTQGCCAAAPAASQPEPAALGRAAAAAAAAPTPVQRPVGQQPGAARPPAGPCTWSPPPAVRPAAGSLAGAALCRSASSGQPAINKGGLWALLQQQPAAAGAASATAPAHADAEAGTNAPPSPARVRPGSCLQPHALAAGCSIGLACSAHHVVPRSPSGSRGAAMRGLWNKVLHLVSPHANSP